MTLVDLAGRCTPDTAPATARVADMPVAPAKVAFVCAFGRTCGSSCRNVEGRLDSETTVALIPARVNG